MTQKKQIIHLEDNSDWIRQVQIALGEEYEVLGFSSLQEAVEAFRDTTFDAAVIDISLVYDDPEDDQGERFMKALEECGILPGKRIIVLSSNVEPPKHPDRMRKYFRDYELWDVIPKTKFDSIEFKQEMDQLVRIPKVFDD